jgi:fibronectin type 3 domain-containing protein
MARISVLVLFAFFVISTVGCVGTPRTAPSVQNARSITLKWNPETSDVVGYYVYRSASSDGPWMRLNASIETTISFTDSSVQGGQLYFYAVSAVSFDYVESDLSQALSVAIP